MLTGERRTLLMAVAIALCCGCDKSPAAPTVQTVDVFTPGITFSPFSMHVPAGSVVRFNIFGDDHNVIFSHAVPGYPSDINIVNGVIVARTFPIRGTFTY